MVDSVNSTPRNPTAYLRRVLKFGLVGTTGLVVNTGLLALFTGVLGIHYLIGAALATQGSTVWNFVITDSWVFRDRVTDRDTWRRFGMFWLMNNGALLIRGPFLWLLTSVFSIHYLLSNLITLVSLMIVRYALSEFWIWRDKYIDAIRDARA